MGTTLAHGIYLPDEGERNCYAGLKLNWETLDQKVADISALQSAIAGALHREIVASLPTTDIDTATIYMILNGTSATENIYDEYMYISNAWELIGTSATDLTNYYTKAEVDGKLLLKASASDLTSHTGDTTIHVTASDKAKWTNSANTHVLRLALSALTPSTSDNSFSNLDDSTALKVGDKVIDPNGVLYEVTAVDTTNQLFTIGTAVDAFAKDAGVLHKTGAETKSGELTLNDTLHAKQINGDTSADTSATSSSSILSLLAVLAFANSDPSVIARLNLCAMNTGEKALYPHETDTYTLGLLSRVFSNVWSSIYTSTGKYYGNEASVNARTNLVLTSNRDTSGKSGLYVTKFRQNKAQGSMNADDLVYISFDVLENEVRTNNTMSIQCSGWVDDVPTKVKILSSISDSTFGSSARPSKINDLEPSALGLPDLSNGVDISGYITTGNTDNLYTPPANGWIWIRAIGNGVGIVQGDFSINANYVSDNVTDERWVDSNLFVTGGVQATIRFRSVSSIKSAKFYPCKGNI